MTLMLRITRAPAARVRAIALRSFSAVSYTLIATHCSAAAATAAAAH
jgi:hypothetical protein